MQLEQPKRISIITGHYGSGKTNIAVNMALDLKKSGKNVTIVDIDIVNPYFRTADFQQMLETAGIKVITPTFANTNLDMPALPASVSAAFNINSDDNSYVIVDVGGDDAGATALGRYSKDILGSDYDFYYVINKYRYLTKEPSEAVELLYEIEAAARVKATKLINNSNLGEETTAQAVNDSLDFAEKISKLTSLPVAFTCCKRDIADSGFYPVDIFVKTIWRE